MKRYGIVAALALALVLFAGSSPLRVGVGAGVPNVASIGGSPNGIGSGSAAVDTVTVVFTMDPATGHARAEHDTAVARADFVYTIGTDLDFAYAYILQTDSINAGLSYNAWRSGSSNSNWLTGSAGQRLGLLRLDLLDVIPGGVTILDARMNAIAAASIYFTGEDSTSATLMTDPGDTLWWNFDTSIGNTAYGYDYWSPAGWSWQQIGQDKGASAVRNYPATSVGPWVMQKYQWEWGGISDHWMYYPDECGGFGGCGAGVSWAAGNVFSIRMKNCFQGIVDGETNNGILLGGRGNGAVRTYYLQNFEQTAGTRNTPWFEVTYVTRRPQAEFPGGKPVAFIFQTDDEIKAANQAYAALFDSVGGHYTLFVREDKVGVGTGAQEYLDFSELLAIGNAGHEIASHSRWHFDTTRAATATGSWYGLNYWNVAPPIVATDYVRGMLPAGLDSATTSTEWDYLLCDTDPVWLYNGLEAAGGDRSALEASLKVGKSLACPGNVYTDAVIKAAVYHGYTGIRVSQVGATTRASGARDWIDTAPRRIAESDTARIGTATFDPAYPQNLRLHPNTAASNVIVGNAAAAPNEATVKRNFRQVLNNAIASGNPVVSIFTHDEKGGRGSNYYTDGINTYELRWMLEVAVDEYNAWLPTTAEYQQWRMARATPIATPAPFGQPAESRYTADERVWFRPWPSGRNPKWVVPSPQDYLVASGKVDTITLDWEAATGAVSYNVYRSDDEAVKATLFKTGITTNTYDDIAAYDDSTKFYRVTPVSRTGHESGWSDLASAKFFADADIDSVPPPTPVLADIPIDHYEHHLTWSASAAGDFSHYRVYRGSALAPTVAATTLFKDNVAVPSFDFVFTPDFAGVVLDTLFNWQVTAVDALGNESPKSNRRSGKPLDLVAPGSPADLYAYGLGDGDVGLTWSAPEDTSDIVAYDVYRSSYADYDSMVLFDNVTSAFAAYAQDADSTYYFAVKAYDVAFNVSGFSNIAVAATTYLDPVIESFALNSIEAADDSTAFNVTATFNKSMTSKLFVWKGPDTAPTDSMAMAPGTGITAVSRVSPLTPWPVADADSTILVEWEAGAPPPDTGYRLDAQYNDGEWFTLARPATIGPAVVSYSHTDADTIPPYRGKWNYRLFAVSGDDFSAVAVVNSPVYNDAIEVWARLRCYDAETEAYVWSSTETIRRPE